MKLATVGTSFVTEHFIEAVLKEGSFNLTTIYSRSEANGRKLADKFGIPLIQTDWDALLNDKDLDVLYIATPNDTHYDLALQAVKAHKHVILEKPFVSHTHQFESLIAIAKANGCYVFDAIMPIHVPNFKVLKDSLPKIGELRMVNMAMVQRSSRYDALVNGQEPAIFSLEHSGGALMDLGVYPISILVGLFGSPKKAQYTCHKYLNGIDVSGVITFTYDTFLAVATIAKDSPGLNFSTFAGDKGYLLVEKSPSIVSSLKLIEKESTTDLSVAQDPLIMSHEIRDFYQTIIHQDDSRYDAWCTITSQVMTLLDTCRKSADLVFAADGKQP